MLIFSTKQNFVGFWLIGTSIGAALTFSNSFGAAFKGDDGRRSEEEDDDDRLGGSRKGSMGVAGLWWGLVIGISATSVVGIINLSRMNFGDEVRIAKERVRGNGDDRERDCYENTNKRSGAGAGAVVAACRAATYDI